MRSALAAFHPRNTLTYLGLCLGFAAVVAALDGRSSAGGVAIAVAVLADTFDGRFARRFRAGPAADALGAQLDSLSDACTFGVAPVVWILSGVPGGPSLLLSVSSFAYLAAVVTRLAFFNLSAHGAPGFIGLPAPAGALILVTAVTAGAGPASLGLTAVLTAAAMIGPWRVPRPAGAGLAAFACWPVALVVALAGRG